MAKHDEWCEFCDDRIKSAVVRVNNREYDVCNQCESLTVQDKDQVYITYLIFGSQFLVLKEKSIIGGERFMDYANSKAQDVYVMGSAVVKEESASAVMQILAKYTGVYYDDIKHGDFVLIEKA